MRRWQTKRYSSRRKFFLSVESCFAAGNIFLRLYSFSYRSLFGTFVMCCCKRASRFIFDYLRLKFLVAGGYCGNIIFRSSRVQNLLMQKKDKQKMEKALQAFWKLETVTFKKRILLQSLDFELSSGTSRKNLTQCSTLLTCWKNIH